MKRSIKSIKDELIKKSREAILAAVQIYNNPQITFKTESFIVLATIAWTYLMHAYYRMQEIDYRYYAMGKTRKKYDRTKYKAYKYWELERCLDQEKCPIDKTTIKNLKFLIGIRNEIEHQKTNNIDNAISAKLQACCMNYNLYIKKLFGSKYAVENELALSLQFSSITPQQKEALLDNKSLSQNVRDFITIFEEALTPEELVSNKYAYRVIFMPVNVNRKGQADRVIEFIKPDSPLAEGLNKEYTLIKETEKPKYIPSQIVSKMGELGYSKFSMYNHTALWKLMKIDFRSTQYGTYVGNKTWMWYESWVEVVKNHCEENKGKYIG